MGADNPAPNMDGASIWDRMQSGLVACPELPANVAPEFCGIDQGCGIAQMRGVIPEHVGGHGDDRHGLSWRSEAQSNEAFAAVVDEAADIEIAGIARGDDNFSQHMSFRGESAQPTIADGGAAANPGLNSRCRAAKGPAGEAC